MANLLTGYIVETTVGFCTTGFCSFISNDKMQHTKPLLPSFHVLSHFISFLVHLSSFRLSLPFSFFLVNVLTFVRLLVPQLTFFFLPPPKSTAEHEEKGSLCVKGGFSLVFIVTAGMYASSGVVWNCFLRGKMLFP